MLDRALLDLKDIGRAFSLALTELRERRGDSQEQLAAKAGISRSFLIALESGKSDVRLSVLLRLAIALDLSFYVFMCEIDRHRTEFTPRAFWSDKEMLEGGVLKICRTGRMDAAKNVPWIIDVYTYAKANGIYKVLWDLSHLDYDISDREQYEATKRILQWLKENSYQPVIAVIYNRTLGDFGINIAKQDGMLIGTFASVEEAHEWLKSR